MWGGANTVVKLSFYLITETLLTFVKISKESLTFVNCLLHNNRVNPPSMTNTVTFNCLNSDSNDQETSRNYSEIWRY